MAGERGGGSDHEEPVRKDQEEPLSAQNRLGSYSRCDKGTEKTTEVERANHGEQRVRLSITVRRVIIDPIDQSIEVRELNHTNICTREGLNINMVTP